MVKNRDTVICVQGWTAVYDEYTSITFHKLLTLVTHEVLCILSHYFQALNWNATASVIM